MNDDLISRKAVLKQIRKIECEPGYQHVGEDWSVGLCIAESIVEEAESVTNPGDVVELPSMSAWIPVSEKLPKPYEDVLVCNPVGDMKVIDGCYSTEIPDEWMWFTTNWRFGNVIAWMPLPKPYKEATR